ncbi:hypothetical protein BKA70DRAFT_119995 [Coprinopsis sp. MPI-PUGE-AT-0042]|nr:hypothetical protein BKA70DRAFT_119995 [Coprinopsis sp. MPI-PUGE-AT-0042]
MEQPFGASRQDTHMDEEFYWEPISFLVGGVLFKVPKDHFVKGSSHFANQYILPHRRCHGPQDGAAAPEHVLLPDVSVEEFRSFLKALYPRSLRQSRAKLSKEQWLPVLKLSTKWFFKDLRRIAIVHLDALELTPTDRVCLGKEYRISGWVLSGYDSLVRNQDLIPDEDAERIGYKSTVTLYISREKRLYDMNPQYLREAFKQELEELEKGEQLHLSDGAQDADDRDVDESNGEDLDARKRTEENEKQVERLEAAMLRLSEKLDKRRKAAVESEATIHDLQKALLRTEAEQDRGLEEHRAATTDPKKGLVDAEAALQKEKEEHQGVLARYRHLEAGLKKEREERRALLTQYTRLHKTVHDANQALAKEKEGRKRDREERQMHAENQHMGPGAATAATNLKARCSSDLRSMRALPPRPLSSDPVGAGDSDELNASGSKTANLWPATIEGVINWYYPRPNLRSSQDPLPRIDPPLKRRSTEVPTADGTTSKKRKTSKV